MEQFLIHDNKSYPITAIGAIELARDIADTRFAISSYAQDRLNRLMNEHGLILSDTDTRDIVSTCVVDSIISLYYGLFTDTQHKALTNAFHHFVNKIRKDVNLSWLRDIRYVFDDIYRLENIVRTYDVGNRFKSDTFWIDGTYLSRKYRKYVRRCEECGDLYISQEALDDDGIGLDNFPSRIIGYDGYCNDCARTRYSQCDYCGRFDEDCSYIENAGNYICSYCLEGNSDIRECEECGALIDLDCGYEYSDQFNAYFCDSNCAERYGLRWSETREDWVDEDTYYDDCEEEENDEVDSIITNYHSHYFSFVYAKDEIDKRRKHDLGIGRETEVDGQSRYDFDRAYYEEMLELFNGNVVFETDGSLDGGFETITMPHSEKLFFRPGYWKPAFDKFIRDGWRSHDTSTCGEHFHYSKWYLGYTFEEQFNSAKKVIAFVEKHWDDIVRLSRRDESELHWCKNFGFIPDKNTEMSDLSCSHSKRYYAVNLEHLNDHRDEDDEDGTIEIRVCKGTLNEKTMLADADFFLHIIRNAKRISWKNIDNLKLWFKGLRKGTIEHLKARGAFTNAF